MSHIKQYLAEHTNNTNIYEKLSTYFKVIDNNNICMLTYKKKKQLTDLTSDDKEFIRKTRGIIIDKYTKDIICYPLDGKIRLHEFKQKTKWDDIVIEESIDGTLINMYYYNDEWNISTNSTLDGHCFWTSNKSFKELFLETLSTYDFSLPQLNKNFTYSFILCHPEARNVTLYKKPKIYHILTRDLHTFNEINLNIGIPKPKILKLDNINRIQCHNYEDIIKYCSTLHFNYEGVMLYSKDRTYRTKIKGKRHIRVNNIRGNHSNIKYTIIDYIQSSKHNIHTLLKYYPEYKEAYEMIIKKINIIKGEIIHIYNEKKKLKNNDFRYHTKYKRAIRELHNQYIYLIKNYKPTIHKYKPCINDKKVAHYLSKEIDTSYLVYLLSSI